MKKEEHSKLKTVCKVAWITMYIAVSNVCQAYALNASTVDIATRMDATSAMGSLIGSILEIFRLGGAAIAAWGGGLFAMSVKNEEPESKQKAIMCMLGGIVLMNIKVILEAMGII